MPYRHILLVEDDIDDQFLFQEALKKIAPSASCTIANDGQEALTKLKYMNPDIIFSDINMPIINGIELLTEIAHINGHAPIVMMSTSSTYEQSYLVSLGASSFFVKPVAFDKLCQQLQSILR